MTSIENSLRLSHPSTWAANLACFMAMIMWAVGFPAAEVMLQSWGVISIIAIRMVLSVSVLLLLWVLSDGWLRVCAAPWGRGLGVGGIGFGFGSILLLVGQHLSDPVTPAIAAAMMPVVGAAIEVVLDARRLRPHLLVGIVLAMVGGFLATGVKLADGSFGLGALLCLLAVILFAWATRATTRDFPGLTTVGQTTITLAGAMVFVLIVYLGLLMTGYQGTEIGIIDSRHVVLLLVYALVSMTFAQLLWIWGAGNLGILLASFHMNAVPFYVMVIVVLSLGGDWDWMQAIGAALVAVGVLVSQSANLKKF